MAHSEDRETAFTVPCTYCNAQPGQPCINKATKQPIQNFVAHIPRLKAAKFDWEEVPF